MPVPMQQQPQPHLMQGGMQGVGKPGGNMRPMMAGQGGKPGSHPNSGVQETVRKIQEEAQKQSNQQPGQPRPQMVQMNSGAPNQMNSMGNNVGNQGMQQQQPQMQMQNNWQQQQQQQRFPGQQMMRPQRMPGPGGMGPGAAGQQAGAAGQPGAAGQSKQPSKQCVEQLLMALSKPDQVSRNPIAFRFKASGPLDKFASRFSMAARVQMGGT